MRQGIDSSSCDWEGTQSCGPQNNFSIKVSSILELEVQFTA